MLVVYPSTLCFCHISSLLLMLFPTTRILLALVSLLDFAGGRRAEAAAEATECADFPKNTIKTCVGWLFGCAITISLTVFPSRILPYQLT